MLTKEQTDAFLAAYQRNYDLVNEWNEKLLRETDADAWVRTIVERSRVIREAFAENERLVARLKDNLPAQWDEGSADIVYEFLINLYYGNYDDFYLTTFLGESLLPYYTRQKQYDRSVLLCNMLGYEWNDFYGYLENGDFEELLIRYYEKVIEQKGHYGEITDIRARRSFFNAYCNLLSPLAQFCPSLQPRVFDLYDEADALWHSDTVQKLDKDNRELRMVYENIKDHILYAADYIADQGREEQERFFRLVTALAGRYAGKDPAGIYLRARYVSDYLQGKLSAAQVMERIMTRILADIPEPDYASEDVFTNFNYVLDYHNCAFFAFEFVKKPDCPEEWRERFRREALPKVMRIHQSIPYSYNTVQANSVCALWYKDAEFYYETAEEKEEFLMKMLVCRQPITYIHSLMVSEIAVRIAERVLDKAPEEFRGACGYQSAEELRANRTELLQFIRRGALLHDVGKCMIAAVINQQNRALSDEEFRLIRLHPNMGLEVIRRSSVLEPFFEVIQGHHRSYDGKTGYPEEYRREDAHAPGIVDLITISDCTDAATDILGRNYAEGKDFDRLFGELAAGAGTKYNPAIVRVIAEDEALRGELRRLTSEGRYEIYYRAYERIREMG